MILYNYSVVIDICPKQKRVGCPLPEAPSNSYGQEIKVKGYRSLD